VVRPGAVPVHPRGMDPGDERGAPEAGPAPRLVPLLVLAVALSLLAALDRIPAWPGLLHGTALPPLDLVNDLGALWVHADGWATFVAGMVGVVLLRSVLLAAVLGGLTWARIRFALRFQFIALPFALVASALLYASKALLFYALFWAGAAVAVAAVAVLGALPWSAPLRLRDSFRRSVRQGFRAGTVAAYLAVLFALGAVADLTGRTGTILLNPVSALATWAAARVLWADPGHRVVRRAVGALPVVLVGALTLVVVTGPARPDEPEQPPPPFEGSLMLMSGIDSSSGSGAILEVDPRAFGWPCERTYYFSYAGPGPGQPRNDARCPIDQGAPYGPEDTLRSRHELVPFLEAQVAGMEPPATIATHSQGVWVVWDAASSGRVPEAGTLVLIGPFPENPVSFPGPGERAPGRAGRAVLGLVAEFPRPGGTTAFEVDAPLGREWLGDPDRIEEVLARPLPDGIRAISITSAFDLPLMTAGHRIEGAVDACPVAVIHPNLPYAEEFRLQVRRFVDGRDPMPCPAWRVGVGALFRHFSVPPSRW
jgi:hypothetical protein